MNKVVVFDLDDTLFPEHQFVLSGFQAVSEWVFDKFSVQGFYVTAETLFNQGCRGKVFDSALFQLNIPYDTSLIEEIVKIYRGHKPKITLYDDAEWAISFFGTNTRLGIITDGYLLTQQNKVASLGIEAKFDVIVYSDAFGRKCWKPSKVPYLNLMETLGCKGDDCFYVGDNPAKDFIEAKNLGWQTVRICRERGEYSHLTCDETHQANYTINSLFQLREIVI